MTTAIILAGGMGTRLQCVIPHLPKPMAPIGGRPFLEHQMDYWIGQGVKRFVLSVGYKKELITDYFGSSYRGTPLTYVIENEPLGTGGGLRAAAQGLNEPFLVLNGDTFFKVDLVELLRFHTDHLSDWTFSLFRADREGRYMGLDLNANGQIMSLESNKAKLGCLSNGGVYLVDPSLIEKTSFAIGLRLSLEDDLIPDLLARGGRFHGLEFFGAFIDIGTPDDYFRAENFFHSVEL